MLGFSIYIIQCYLPTDEKTLSWIVFPYYGSFIISAFFVVSNASVIMIRNHCLFLLQNFISSCYYKASFSDGI